MHDLHATILYLLGIDHTKLTYKYSGSGLPADGHLAGEACCMTLFRSVPPGAPGDFPVLSGERSARLTDSVGERSIAHVRDSYLTTPYERVASRDTPPSETNPTDNLRQRDSHGRNGLQSG